MEAEYLLQKFVEHGEKMRNAQKGYFSIRGYDQANAEKKKEFLSESKKAEREFDELVESAKRLFPAKKS